MFGSNRRTRKLVEVTAKRQYDYVSTNYMITQFFYSVQNGVACTLSFFGVSQGNDIFQRNFCFACRSPEQVTYPGRFQICIHKQDWFLCPGGPPERQSNGSCRSPRPSLYAQCRRDWHRACFGVRLRHGGQVHHAVNNPERRPESVLVIYNFEDDGQISSVAGSF